jgi:hypothetical protein
MNYYAAFGIVFLFLGGLYLDQSFQTGSVWSISGLILGIVYLAYEIWKAMIKK